MNILFYDMGSYTYQDTLFYLKQLGHTCKTVYYHFPNKFHDDFFCDRLEKQLQSDSCDAVMSINFFPLAAALCHEHQLPYLAWCYDIPASRYAPWILWVQRCPVIQFPARTRRIFQRWAGSDSL